MDLKDTLNLPKTTFRMKGNLAKREPEILEEWDERGIHQKITESRKDSAMFVLHDGPPYANGNIHYGHILNKVLKDIVVKFHTMAGLRTYFRPGWDCHGLPIEIHVDKSLGKKKETIPVVERRRLCRDYAMSFVDIQREEFKRLGCFGDWENPYLTLHKDYEASIVRELGRFIEEGYLYRGRKPVYWCGSCGTALAEAEVEYAERKSPSIYVKLPLEEDPSFLGDVFKGKKVSLAVWTTTPWTIPANLAVVVWPSYKYQALEIEGEYLIVAQELVASFLSDCALEPTNRIDIDVEQLIGKKYIHPLMDPKGENDFKVWSAPHVTLEQGTGLVHTAPGHGVEDYRVGLEHDLQVFAPVDDKGCFTEEVPAYEGTYVHDANDDVIGDLIEKKALLNPKGQKVAHSYPNCWRCKQPIVFRATPQWFVDLEHKELRRRALEEIDKTKWIPHWGRDRIFGMVEGRPDWCLSRQRVWGVPLPIFYCSDCGEPLIDADVAYHIADLFAEHGSDCWFEKGTKDLIPKGRKCSKCSSQEFVKETDIVDVWFESGVSWAAVCEKEAKLGIPVDLYLEGSDQHRGWFHSALLTGVATRDAAPYKAVLTHGFVVNKDGQPYSKTLKNYSPPKKILDRSGAEMFRLWVASEDYRNDIRISEEILKRLGEGYRRIRNTCRFLLGNISDFHPQDNFVKPSEREEEDKWVLSRLDGLIEKVTRAYENYEFHKVFHSLLSFSSNDLSSLYLDVVKDRLYCETKEGKTRRSAQSTIYEIAKSLALLSAPVLSFTAEDIWKHIPSAEEETESVHLGDLPKQIEGRRDKKLEEAWDELKLVRSSVTRALEPFRAQKHHSLDACITVSPASDFQRKVLEDRTPSLADLFIVSGVTITKNNREAISDKNDVTVDEEEPLVKVEPAPGIKCPRCWKRTEEPKSAGSWGEVCPRCANVLDDFRISSTD